jgi:uncharacterized membrane protein YkvA (DUF1232 family)
MNRNRMIRQLLVRGSQRLFYSGLLLYYALKRSDLPTWARSVVIGVIGYLLSPIDSIPDITPIIGYTDDLGLLSYALVLISAYINTDVRTQAREKLFQLTGKRIESEDIQAVEKML